MINVEKSDISPHGEYFQISPYDRCVFPREGGAKDVYQAVHQITPHIHMMWVDTIFIRDENLL